MIIQEYPISFAHLKKQFQAGHGSVFRAESHHGISLNYCCGCPLFDILIENDYHIHRWIH
jgi:hypothetical protein